jgi:hypothetical protein
MRVSDRLRRPDFRPVVLPRDPVPFWERHPNIMGMATIAFFMLIALLTSGCDLRRCGVLWPC